MQPESDENSPNKGTARTVHWAAAWGVGAHGLEKTGSGWLGSRPAVRLGVWWRKEIGQGGGLGFDSDGSSGHGKGLPRGCARASMVERMPPCSGLGGETRTRGGDVLGGGAWWVRMGAGGGLPRLFAPELCCRVGCGYEEGDCWD